MVFATSASMTSTSREAEVIQIIQTTQMTQKVALDRVLCIYYLEQFRKDKGAIIQALINSSSKVKTMTLAYIKQLGF